MPAVARISRKQAKGLSTPRIAPPVPAHSLIADFRAAATELGIEPMAWQTTAARYLTATKGPQWLFREVVVVVARQNGKTALLLPRILMGLERGERMLHTAQNRALPRETFLAVARLVNGRKGIEEIRFANGQELIRASNGGRYTLVAPRPGVRGHATDTVFLDEVREQRSFDLMASIKPTLTASRNPQIVYLSNAGDSDSIVLNDLRRRFGSAPRLCYLEWSAAPERALEDREGWAEANPALGITIQMETLEDFHASLPPAVFETEHLCRWVTSTQPKLVPDYAWERARSTLESMVRPVLGISMDPSGNRASAMFAWQQSDGSIGLRKAADVHGGGGVIDVDKLGVELRDLAYRVGAFMVAYDDLTDRALASYFRRSKHVTGRDFCNASENFARLVGSGRLRWEDADDVTEDLLWTARKPHESGAWVAVKAKDDRPITSVLAAIRATWLVSQAKPSTPRVL